MVEDIRYDVSQIVGQVSNFVEMGDISGFSISASTVYLPQIHGVKASTANCDRKAQASQDFVTSRSFPREAPVLQPHAIPSASILKQKIIKPSGMQRAKIWTLEVENAYRYQLAGFKDESEYLFVNPLPEMWSSSGMIKCLTVKDTGYFMYFRQVRECEDKHLNKVKLFQY